MEITDQPHPEIYRDENLKVRRELDEIIAIDEKEEPRDDPPIWYYTRGDRNDPQREQVGISSRGITLNSLDPSLETSNVDFSGDIERMKQTGWNPRYTKRSRFFSIVSHKDWTPLFQDGEGHIYAGQFGYYFDDQGHAAKTSNFTELTPDRVDELKNKGAYADVVPLPPLPQTHELAIKGLGYKIKRGSYHLDPSDYEKIGATLSQIKSGEFKLLSTWDLIKERFNL